MDRRWSLTPKPLTPLDVGLLNQVSHSCIFVSPEKVLYKLEFELCAWTRAALDFEADYFSVVGNQLVADAQTYDINLL